MHFGNLEPIEHSPSTLYSDLRILQDEISKQFDVVKEWKEIWNEYGFEKPNDLTISRAENVIEKSFDQIISADYRFTQ